MNKKALKLLQRSFDENLSEVERQSLEQALQTSSELRAEKARISTWRKSVLKSAANSFQPFFAAKVMQRIASLKEVQKLESIFFESLFAAFRPAFLTAAILFLTLLSYNVGKSDNFSIAGAFAEPEVTLEQVIDPTISFFLE